MFYIIYLYLKKFTLSLKKTFFMYSLYEKKFSSLQ